jgi:aryl carrier-like protein
MQFSAFVFDVSITEIFMSLTRGGVLCIPSEDERMNGLESAFNRMGANWAHLTPTVASLLVPDKVPTLRHLALAGEPLKKVNITDWAPKLQLINLYGPAECALATTIRVGCDRDDRPDNIGRAVGLLVWIIDPSNTDHLVPVGAVGEILLEGPNIAREYLKDKDRTISSFIENPAWLHEERTIPPRRFYRSGDLARYNGDGSIQILGRIDTQVKLHGQRVELGEIEYQVKMNLSPHGLTNMAVVYAKSTEHAAGGFLSVFLEFKEGVAHFDESQLPKTIPMHLRTVLVKLKSHLSDTLPSYMVPAIFVPLHQMPLLTAGKIDRSELTRIAMQLSPEESRLYALSELRDEKGSPRTRMERLFCQLWADVLNADARTIGTGDSFFRIGGDSVVAMRLSAAGRKAGVTITVADIFQNSKLSDMATVAKPFSESTIQQLEKSHTIRREIVQHIFPCTPLQEGLMIVSSRLPGTYTTQHIFYLPPTVVVQRFAAAWQLVHTSCPILRTRIISVQGMIGTIQVVVDEGISWRRAVNLQQYLERDKLLPMVYGEPLTRYALVNEEQSGKQYFVWTAHHSVFDSRSLSLLFSEVQNAYEGLASVAHPNADFSKSSPYKQFVDHVFNSDISEAEHF